MTALDTQLQTWGNQYTWFQKIALLSKTAIETTKKQFPAVTKSIFSEYTVHQADYQEGSWHGYETSMERRTCFRMPLQTIYSRLIERCQLQASRILEIGCGKLNEKNQSYLSSLMPHRSWFFSDTARLAALHPNLRQVNIITAEQKINELFSCVIGSCVVDTFSYEMFPQIFKNIAKHTLPGGYFIHVADMDLQAEAFYEACTRGRTDHVFFPTGSSSEKLYCIKKQKYEQILKEKVTQRLISHEEFDFFSYWGSYHSYHLIESLPDIQSLGSTLEPAGTEKEAKSINKLGKRFFEIFSTDIETINAVQIFEQSLKEAATQNGFEIASCGSETVTTEGKPLQNHTYNYYRLIHGHMIPYKIYVLNPSITLWSATTHVFVARLISANGNAPQSLSSALKELKI